MEPVRVPIEDVLDLHHFRPGEVRDLLDDYLEECRKAGFESVRIIHGKGSGSLKRMVRSHLEKSNLVDSVRDAPEHAGGWGATLAILKKNRV